MSNFDDFWERMVDEGILGPDAAGRARARHAQFGGGLDTAVYEFSTLDQSEKAYVLHAAADVVGLPVAETEYLDAPDFEALVRLTNRCAAFPFYYRAMPVASQSLSYLRYSTMNSN